MVEQQRFGHLDGGYRRQRSATSDVGLLVRLRSDLVTRRIRSVPGVRSTETFMYLKLAKQVYSWGVR